MIRTCPKCGDYDADASLAFCLVDGTPLVDVEPLNESWSEGARVIEEKGNALRKQKRRLKWRRFLLSAMTTLVVTLVVCVVAINGFIYLRPKQEEVVRATPLTPTPTPTPTPIPVYKISGRVTDRSKALGGVNIALGGAKSASTTTDANGNYTFNGLLTGSYIITPARAKIEFTPPTRSINNLMQDELVDFVGTVQPECSVADESREREIILNTFSDTWRQSIEDEGDKTSAENTSFGVANANGRAVSVNPEITFWPIEIKFLEICRASVTVKYAWLVKKSLNGRSTDVSIPGERRFACAKTGETWRCS